MHTQTQILHNTYQQYKCMLYMCHNILWLAECSVLGLINQLTPEGSSMRVSTSPLVNSSSQTEDNDMYNIYNSIRMIETTLCGCDWIIMFSTIPPWHSRDHQRYGACVVKYYTCIIYLRYRCVCVHVYAHVCVWSEVAVCIYIYGGVGNELQLW